MKRLTLFILAILPFVTFAQKVIDEKDVPTKFTQDFQTNYEHAKKVKWYQIDSISYEVKFLSNDTKTSIVFKSISMETRWEVESKYIPTAIKTYITENHPKAKIDCVHILDISKNKSYEVVIREKKEQYLLSFEIDGKYRETVKKEIAKATKKVKK